MSSQIASEFRALADYLSSRANALDTVPSAVEPRYSSPVGTVAERATGDIWPGDWIDANGWDRWYWAGTKRAIHTGADLNLNEPDFDSDKNAPIVSIGPGTVYAIRQFSGWGFLICIRHPDCLSRYAHVRKTSIQVREGQAVLKGTYIANIGNASGLWPYHLHMDIARLNARMATVPGDWPGTNRERVLRDYYDPLVFLRERAR